VIEGLAIFVPAGTMACDWIDATAIVALDRGPTLDVECDRHNGEHTGEVTLTEILPYL
jgi:hypothetical protein